MIDLWRLHLLRELSMLGTISRVAEVVNQTRPAVSQQLALLEKEMGTALFERSGRGVTLTHAGENLVTRSGDIFSLMNSIESDFAEAKGQVTGEIRISAFGSLATTLVPACCQLLKLRYPDLNIKFEELEPAEGMKAAATKQIDLALIDDSVKTEPMAGSLYFRPLMQDFYAVVLPRGHRLSNQKSIELDDLAHESWAINRAASTYRGFLMDACAASGFKPNVTASCRNINATLELVRAGFVITILPMLALRNILDDPDFKILPVQPLTKRHIFTAMSPGMHKRPSFNAILSALDEIVPKFQ